MLSTWDRTKSVSLFLYVSRKAPRRSRHTRSRKGRQGPTAGVGVSEYDSRSVRHTAPQPGIVTTEELSVYLTVKQDITETTLSTLIAGKSLNANSNRQFPIPTFGLTDSTLAQSHFRKTTRPFCTLLEVAITHTPGLPERDVTESTRDPTRREVPLVLHKCVHRTDKIVTANEGIDRRQMRNLVKRFSEKDLDHLEVAPERSPLASRSVHSTTDEGVVVANLECANLVVSKLEVKFRFSQETKRSCLVRRSTRVGEPREPETALTCPTRAQVWGRRVPTRLC